MRLVLTNQQCDQIGRFIILWVTFQSTGQQLFCPIRQHILGNFCKIVKIFHFSREILFGQLLQTFGDFLLVTLPISLLYFKVVLVAITLC